MNINIPQSYFSKLMRAVVEFELIEQGDRILIGVSGGKDSIFLTYALAILRERLKKDFTIAAFTVNPQFDTPLNTDAIASFCKSLDVPYGDCGTGRQKPLLHLRVFPARRSQPLCRGAQHE